MSFGSVVAKVISLANEQALEDDRIEHEAGFFKKDPNRSFLDRYVLSSPEWAAYMAAPTPAQDALHTFLKTLDRVTVSKIQTLMYVGLGNDDLRGLHKRIGGCSKKDAVRTIMEKAPLAEYLAAGLIRARKIYVDIEGSF